MERWVGVGEPGRGEETGGEGREAPSLVSACWVPTRPPERAAQSRGTWKRAGRPRAPRRWAGLVRGARARSQPRPKLDQGPRLGARAEQGSATPAPPPPRAAGKAVGLSRQTRESEAEADTWGTFPPRLEFHRKHMRRRSRHGRGRGGNFPLLLAGFESRSRGSGKAEAPRATPQGRAPGLRGEPERGGEGGSPRWIPGRAMGPALPWWFSSGIYILVFSLTIDQKLF